MGTFLKWPLKNGNLNENHTAQRDDYLCMFFRAFASNENNIWRQTDSNQFLQNVKKKQDNIWSRRWM